MEMDFLKGARIIKKHEQFFFKRKIPLENFRLKKGRYSFQMVYYCGKVTAEVLRKEKVDQSEAELFQGCATSVKIPFIVK
jgi:hypothetical protein